MRRPRRTPNNPALTLTLTALAALLTSLPALAADESCFRDTQCPGQQQCIEQSCVDAPGNLNCESDADCDGLQVCHQGACKDDRVRCDSVAGSCWMADGAGESECRCEDGGFPGWNDPNAGSKSDEELHAECVEALEKECGTTPPQLPESCTGDTLKLCEAAAENRSLWDEVCEGAEEDIFRHTLACCEAMEALDTVEDEFERGSYPCLADIPASDNCEQLDAEILACFYGTDPDADNNDEDTSDTDDSDDPTQDTDDDMGSDDEASGCAVAPRSSGMPALLGAALLLLGLRRRRRRL